MNKIYIGNSEISVSPYIFTTTQLYDNPIDVVLACIKDGDYFCRDLKGITAAIQSLSDHDQQNELKKRYLPVALFNGTFSYKDSGSLIQYNCFTALDFDNIQSQDEYTDLWLRLTATPCVYAVYRTPSGKGLKAIIQHDNTNPDYHGEMYAQLLARFNTSQLDPSGSDLARGSYLCYDPNLWKNQNCEPYHFEHDPAYKVPVRSNTSYGAVLVKDIAEFKTLVTGRPLKGMKSDESIIAILNAHWRKDPNRWRQGNRANSVYNSASQMCRAGVDLDAAVDYLVGAYIPTGLIEEEIQYHALRGYQCNAGDYGSTRQYFDKYHSKKN